MRKLNKKVLIENITETIISDINNNIYNMVAEFIENRLELDYEDAKVIAGAMEIYVYSIKQENIFQDNLEELLKPNRLFKIHQELKMRNKGLYECDKCYAIDLDKNQECDCK